MQRVIRYHPILVILHWLLAALIIAALCIGFLSLAATPNTDPGKIAVLRLHMAGGMLILALTVLRAVTRKFTAHPAPISTGNRLADSLAPLTHYGFYALILLMVGTGYATGIIAGLPAIVFANSGDPLPPRFDAYPTFTVHFYLSLTLLALIVLHIAAALYHHAVRKDGLLRRMAFGKRRVDISVAAE
jgi:cytochrome b561